MHSITLHSIIQLSCHPEQCMTHLPLPETHHYQIFTDAFHYVTPLLLTERRDTMLISIHINYKTENVKSFLRLSDHQRYTYVMYIVGDHPDTEESSFIGSTSSALCTWKAVFNHCSVCVECRFINTWIITSDVLS